MIKWFLELCLVFYSLFAVITNVAAIYYAWQWLFNHGSEKPIEWMLLFSINAVLICNALNRYGRR